MSPVCHLCKRPSNPEAAFADPTGVGPPIPLCTKCRATTEEVIESLVVASKKTRFNREDPI
jgi:hypothetical protein